MAETETVLEKYKREAEERAAAIKERQEAAPYPPSIRSLCLENTLYALIQLNPKRDAKFLESLKFGGHQFDAYCVYCGYNSTFRTLTDRKPSSFS